MIARRVGGIAAGALATALIAAGCVGDPPEPLRVGINAWPGYEYLYLADVQGFYAREGVEVQLLEFGSLSDTRRAYERGQLDAMGSSIVEALVVRDRSPRSPRIVRAVDYTAGADVLLAQPWITEAAALRGARIGVELAAVPTLLLVRGLERLGLRTDEVRVESMSPAAMEAAFRAGALDAAVTYPPVSVRLTRDAGATTLFSSRDVPREIFDVIVAEGDVARTRRREIAAMLRAFDAAKAWADAHPVDAAAIMADREGLAPDEFQRAISDGVVHMTATDQAAYLAADGPLEQAVRHADALLRRAGHLQSAARLDDLVDRSFAAEVPR